MVYIIAGPPPLEAPPTEAADHPDLFIPKPVQEFLPRFRRYIQDKVRNGEMESSDEQTLLFFHSLQNLVEILNSYEVEFNRLSDRWFTEDPWPPVEQVASLDDGRIADGTDLRVCVCVCVREFVQPLSLFR